MGLPTDFTSGEMDMSVYFTTVFHFNHLASYMGFSYTYLVEQKRCLFLCFFKKGAVLGHRRGLFAREKAVHLTWGTKSNVNTARLLSCSDLIDVNER